MNNLIKKMLTLFIKKEIKCMYIFLFLKFVEKHYKFVISICVFLYD